MSRGISCSIAVQAVAPSGSPNGSAYNGERFLSLVTNIHPLPQMLFLSTNCSMPFRHPTGMSDSAENSTSPSKTREIPTVRAFPQKDIPLTPSLLGIQILAPTGQCSHFTGRKFWSWLRSLARSYVSIVFALS
jgi:hypothetical protein